MILLHDRKGVAGESIVKLPSFATSSLCQPRFRLDDVCVYVPILLHGDDFRNYLG